MEKLRRKNLSRKYREILPTPSPHSPPLTHSFSISNILHRCGVFVTTDEPILVLTKVHSLHWGSLFVLFVLWVLTTVKGHVSMP